MKTDLLNTMPIKQKSKLEYTVGLIHEEKKKYHTQHFNTSLHVHADAIAINIHVTRYKPNRVGHSPL